MKKLGNVGNLGNKKNICVDGTGVCVCLCVTEGEGFWGGEVSLTL